MAESKTAKTTKPPKRGCGCLTAFLLFVLIILVLGGVGWWKWTDRPAYFDAYEDFLAKTSEFERAQLANELTSNVSSTVSASGNHSIEEPLPDGGGPNVFDAGSAADPRIRTLTITVDQANAWIEKELTGWLGNQGVELPETIKQLAIGLEGDKILIGCQFETEELTQWFTVVLKVNVKRMGKVASIKVDRTMAGSLPIPASWILSYLNVEEVAGDYAHIIKDAAGAGYEFEPVATMPGHTHRIRIIGYKVTDGQVTLKLRSEEKDDEEDEKEDQKEEGKEEKEGKKQTPKAQNPQP